MAAADESLYELLKKSKEAVVKMTAAEYETMLEAQREAFVRAVNVPCEHGVLDFEIAETTASTPSGPPRSSTTGDS